MHFPCSENKGTDQLRSYCAADLRLCFRICKKPVSHNEAQMMFLWLLKKQYQRRCLNLFNCLSVIMFSPNNSKVCSSYFQNIYMPAHNSSDEPQQLLLTTERHNSTMSVLEAGKNCNSLHVTKCYK